MLKALVVLLAFLLGSGFVRDFRGRVLLKNAATSAEKKDWPQTEEAAAQAVRLNPSLGYAWYYKGVGEAGQGRIEEARRDLSRAARLMDNPSLAPLTLGEILAERGMSLEAIPFLESALLINPRPRLDPARYWELLAACRRKESATSPAAPPALWMALAVGDFPSRGLLPLAESYRALGHDAPRFPDALALYLAWTHSPDVALKGWVVGYYERQGRKDLVVAFLDDLINRGKAEPRDYVALALSYNELRRPAKALDILSKAAPAMDGDPVFHFAMGQAAEQTGDKAAMRRAYERYLQLSPNAPDRAEIEAKLR